MNKPCFIFCGFVGPLIFVGLWSFFDFLVCGTVLLIVPTVLFYTQWSVWSHEAHIHELSSWLLNHVPHMSESELCKGAIHTLHQYVLKAVKKQHFTAHSQGQIYFGLYRKFMPHKNKSTPKGYYFSLAAIGGEYDVTAISESRYLWGLLLKRQIKRPIAPLLWIYQKLLIGEIIYLFLWLIHTVSCWSQLELRVHTFSPRWFVTIDLMHSHVHVNVL